MRTAAATGDLAGPITMPPGVATLVDVLAARCREALLAIAAQGGPDVDAHMALLRRAMARSSGRTHRDRDRIERTLAAIAAGVGPVAGATGRRADDRRMLTDLRHLERALTRAARVGGFRDTAPAPASVRRPASPRADG